MPLIEDLVKTALHRYLQKKGFSGVESKMGTRQGYDVEGVNPLSGRRLVIECKGEVVRGSTYKLSWDRVASALLTSINEIENPERDTDVGMAFPDTSDFRERTRFLRGFLEREGISLFWVSEDGGVTEW